MNITILGGGSWGTAIALHLAKNSIDNKINIWEFFQDQAVEMQTTRKSRFLPDIELPNNITVTSNIEESLVNTKVVFVVVPSDKVESTLKNARDYLKEQPVVVCSKGFSNNTDLLSITIEKIINNDLYFFYGPTIADEVAKGKPAGAVIAGVRGSQFIIDLLRSDDFFIESSTDIIGVQISAALKNLLAICIGIVDGLEYGDNAKAYIMTKGLQEISLVGKTLGAKLETFYGLAGMGDVIVTCTSELSRNRYVGKELAKGRKLNEILVSMTMVAEGVNAAKHAYELSRKYDLDLPIITSLYKILFEGTEPSTIFAIV